MEQELKIIVSYLFTFFIAFSLSKKFDDISYSCRTNKMKTIIYILRKLFSLLKLSSMSFLPMEGDAASSMMYAILRKLSQLKIAIDATAKKNKSVKNGSDKTNSASRNNVNDFIIPITQV